MGAPFEANPVVGIAMGSDSDRKYLIPAAETLRDFEVPYEARVTSAHRTEELMIEYGKTSVERGLRVILACAGGSAHLPGMLASVTRLPVIGIPVGSSERSVESAEGSMNEMPPGVPLATTGVLEKGARAAALFAIRILAITDPELASKIHVHKEGMRLENVARDARMRETGLLDYTQPS